MNSRDSILAEVKGVLVETLGIHDRQHSLTESTPLLDNLPELDSMAVLQVMLAIEERFNVRIDDEDVTPEIFETLGTLAAFVQAKMQ